MFNPANILKDQAQSAVATGPPVWQSGVCDCTQDTGICLQTLCCLPCTFSNIFNKLDFNLAVFDCGACMAILIGGYGTNNQLFGWASFGLRRELVQRYGIQGESICSSCVSGTCCFPCSICQVQREMSKRREFAGGACANPPPETAAPSLAQHAMGAIIGAVQGAVHVAARPPKVWGSGLCDCGPAECIEGIFCPCCIFGFMATRLNAGKTAEVPLGSPNIMDPITCCASLWYLQGHVYAHRREVVQRYNIIGESHTLTCVNTLCCAPCALCQQRREMGYNGEWAGGIIVKEVIPPPANPPH